MIAATFTAYVFIAITLVLLQGLNVRIGKLEDEAERARKERNGKARAATVNVRLGVDASQAVEQMGVVSEVFKRLAEDIARARVELSIATLDDNVPEPECVACGQPARTMVAVPKEWSGKVCQACWDRRETHAKVDENGAYSEVVSISNH